MARKKIIVNFADRYSATGKPRPNPKTVCLGPCEGMGFFPCKRGDTRYAKLFKQALAEGKEPDSLGYIFLTCPECKGSGLRSKEASHG